MTVWNSADKSSSVSLSGADLTANVPLNSGSSYRSVRSTTSKSSGKFFVEATIVARNGAGNYVLVGFAKSTAPLDDLNGLDADFRLYASFGNRFDSASNTYGATYDDGDVIGMAIDLDAGTITFYKNGTSQGQAFSSVTGTWFVFFSGYADASNGPQTVTVNFGATGFVHAVPGGYEAWDPPSVSPVAIKRAEALGPVVVSAGAVTVAPHGIAGPCAVGPAVVADVGVQIIVHPVTARGALGAPTAVPGAVTVAPVAVKSAERLGVLGASTAPVLQTKRWVGKASAVAQVATVTIGAFDTATSYRVTIGGVTVAVVGTTDANTTATNLRAALVASTHPYFDAITWTVNGTVITATAAVAGAPFVSTASVSGGTGSISQAAVTASAGPNDWSTPANWDPVGVPNSTDFVYFEDSAVNCCWGLDQSVVALSALVIRQSYTGRIGLRHTQFATSSDGATTAAQPEYRGDYLSIGWVRAEIGTPGAVAELSGSQRLKLNNISAAAAVTVVHDTADAAPTGETHLPAVRLLLNHANHDLYVRSAPGGVGVAVEKAGEVSTCGLVSVSDVSEASKVWIGAGVTLTSFEQLGGSNVVQASGTIGSLRIEGGVLQLEGDYAVTTLTIEDGTVYDNHLKSGGDAVSTLNLNGGVLDFRQATQDRSIGTLNLAPGAVLHADGGVITFGARNLPASLFSLGAN